MIHYIKLLRPLQWLKNVFVFAPIFFSNNLLKGEYFWPTLVVFASFCLISSSIYCFNDLKDVSKLPEGKYRVLLLHGNDPSVIQTLAGGSTVTVLTCEYNEEITDCTSGPDARPGFLLQTCRNPDHRTGSNYNNHSPGCNNDTEGRRDRKAG